MKKIGVLRFLGTNCDQDVLSAIRDLGLQGEFVWYQNRFDWQSYGALILPGGFSHGDYLRAGALAARAPVIESLLDAAKKGVPVLGICNGFQVLCETGLLPGALLRNSSLRFVDKWVTLKRHGGASTVRLPIAHGDGRYYIPAEQLPDLFENDQVWWTYEENPNGSIESIAGVLNQEKNVAGLMPHPERAIADWMGSTDGISFFKELLQ